MIAIALVSVVALGTSVYVVVLLRRQPRLPDIGFVPGQRIEEKGWLFSNSTATHPAQPPGMT